MRVGNRARGFMQDTIRVVLLKPWQSYPAGKDLSLGKSVAVRLIETGFARQDEVSAKSMASGDRQKAVRKKVAG